MFWFVLFLILLGAAFFFFQKLKEVEEEIRAMQQSETSQTPAEPVKDKVVAAKAETSATKPAVTSTADAKSGNKIIAAIKANPGMKQTELYSKFPKVNKKVLQQQVKDLSDSGQIKREKSGSSYLLYPV